MLYRGSSLIRKRHPLGSYRRPLPRALGGGISLWARCPCTEVFLLEQSPQTQKQSTDTFTSSGRRRWGSRRSTLSLSLLHTLSHSLSHKHTLSHTHRHSLSQTRTRTVALALPMTRSPPLAGVAAADLRGAPVLRRKLCRRLSRWSAASLLLIYYVKPRVE